MTCMTPTLYAHSEAGVLPTALDTGLGAAQGTSALLASVTEQSVASTSRTRSRPANGPGSAAASSKKELKWGDLPVGNLTPEVERDLRLLRMRNYLDPKIHFKGSDSKALPKHFQVRRVF